MKRKYGIVVGIAALGLVAYLGSRLWAQSTAAAPRPTSKIAVVNLPLVIKNYKKYVNYEQELESFAKGYAAEEAKIKKKVMDLQTASQKDPNANRDTVEQEMKDYKRQLEDLAAKFKKEFAKKQEMQLVTLYKEVEDMVARVAQYNGFEMVLQYSDAINPKDAYNPMIIQRKVLGGVCLPMYAAPGLDISVQVYTNLNAYYKQPTGAAAPH